ncbi:MAG: prepilin-type N-terminal cleavage/methylation domain-containing protein, partial [Deltaproteobacteria bacterium]
AMKDRRGFTLIEIMIALTIVGIVGIIATTNFTSWQSHYTAVGFQREFLSKVNEARTRSMGTSLQHRLRIDLGAETVALERGNAGTASGTWVNATPQALGTRGAGIQQILCNPAPASVTSGTFAFIFNPDGEVLTQDNAATIRALTDARVRLSADSTADQTTIRLYGWTSKARLENGWP